MSLPTDSKERKDSPVVRGFLDYFPDAVLACARLSVLGNEKHNPGEPLHWSKDKSNDHADCVVRHTMERGKVDYSYGADKPVLHSVAALWRAAANAQTEIEELKEKGQWPLERGRTPAVEGNLWRFHDGGEMPCRPDQTVEVIVRCGDKFIMKRADEHIWPHGCVIKGGTDPSRPHPQDIMQWMPA